MFSFNTRLVNKLRQHIVRAMQRRQGNVRFKTKAGGQQEREALLETKTHRRVNRRQVCTDLAYCQPWLMAVLQPLQERIIAYSAA